MLRPYRDDDLDLHLRLLTDPDTMVHLGGPETREQVERRHRRCLGMTDPDDGLMFTIETDDGVAAGTIGYWSRDWHDTAVWESGWFVLTELRGRGIASSALRDLVGRLTARPTRRYLHAFPSVDNRQSNALCAAVGFTSSGPVDGEYPAGHALVLTDWRYDLRPERPAVRP